MSQKLAGLKLQLSVLRWRRWCARVVDGAMAVALMFAFALAGDFFVDWTFRFSRGQRAVLLAALGAIAIWALRRFIWPALVSLESVINLALKIERRQGIDSDLVAALQFESPGAKDWGSPQLETAVVNAVAIRESKLQLDRGLPGVRLSRKAIPLAVILAMLGSAAAFYPRYTTAFFKRLLLGAAHYPTNTTVERITVNGVKAFPAHVAGEVAVPFGPGLKFEIEASGTTPPVGEVRLIGTGLGASTSVLLTPGEAPGSYRGELPRIVDHLTYQVLLGDAWTEPGKLRVILPPVVSLELEHHPPAYANRERATRSGHGSRQISVLEGSQVTLAVTCANKSLAKVELIIGEGRYSLVPGDTGKNAWKSPAGTPLDVVTTTTMFEVQVLDDDGLSPDQPLRGQIHIEADRPPRVAAAIVTENVLPAARPSISWGAADDNGLAEIRLIKQVTRTTGEGFESTDAVQIISPEKQPVVTLRGKHVLDLKPLGLATGDAVRVTLEAVDFRGGRPGVSTRSEPIVFNVTDESGILAGLVEADEKSARQLDQIIQRQLGIEK